MSFQNNHFHDICDFANLEYSLDEKSSISHSHNEFTKNQLVLLNNMLKEGTLFKSISFDLLKNVVFSEDSVILYNFKVLDLKNNLINIDFDYMNIILDEDTLIPINELEKSESEELGTYFVLSKNYLKNGVNKFCIKYKDSYSEDFKIFVLDKNNLFEANICSGTDYMLNTKGAVSGSGQFVESSDEWSSSGDRSLKISVNNSFSNWTDIYTSKVFDGDEITAEGKIFNQDCSVSIFFVFIDYDGKQSFSGSKIVEPSDVPQDFKLKSVVPEDIEKIHVRFWLRGQLGSSIYIDDIKLVTKADKKHIATFGSCAVNGVFTSSFNKNYKKNYIREVKSQCHSLISIMQPKNLVKKSLLRIPKEFDDNGFKTDCLIRDFEKRFISIFLMKDIDYLIMDVYFDVDKGILMYDGNTIISNVDGFNQTKFYNSIKNSENITLFNNHEKYFDLWKKSCDEFFDFLRLYSPKTKVILSEIKVIDKIQDENGVIRFDKSLSKKAEKYNPLIKQLEDYIKENYGVIVLSFDEDAVYKENERGYSLYYSDEYYSNFLDKLDNLIENS